MDIQKILAELREQRDQVAAELDVLEKIAFRLAAVLVVWQNRLAEPG